jgi:hypothetical protein
MVHRLDVETIDREGRVVVIRFRPNARLDPMRLVKVVAGWPGATLVPPVSVKLDVEDRAMPKGENPAGSWWTARATAGEVRPGFSKEEILRRPETDPLAEGGMFSRLLGFLQALGPAGQSF